MVHPSSLYNPDEMKSTDTATVALWNPLIAQCLKRQATHKTCCLANSHQIWDSPILPIHRDDSSTQRTIDFDPLLRQIIDEMCVKLSLCIDNINIIHEQYHTMFQNIIRYPWRDHCGPLEGLRVDLAQVNFEPVITLLVDFTHGDYSNKLKQQINHIQSIIDSTFHNMALTRTANNTQLERLLSASLEIFTNYTKHRLQPEVLP